MTVSLKHAFTSNVADSGDATLVQPSNWNAEHNLTANANSLLGTVTAGSVTEITCTSAGRDLLDDADAAAQRTTLGLGTLATQSGTFSGTSSGTNTGDQNIFQTISVSGQSNVVADSTADTLTLAAGSNITITTNAASDTVTIASTAFPSGTLMLFQQTAAPTGWTKSTTHDNKALRVVSGTAGTGGSVAFTTAFASQSISGTVGSTTLTEANMPSHGHTLVGGGATGSTNWAGVGNSGFSGSNGGGSATYTNYGTSGTRAINLTGSSTSHNHSFTGTAVNLAVQYVDLIIASKD